jgi:DNA mismatch repair ATPase MutS
MLYQGPTFKTLGEHGKFGTELKATRKVFMRATERSLVVLDEVGDGTNAEEGIRQTSAVLWGLKKLGSGTVVVTHNRELVRQLEGKGIGVAYQMNTRDDKPDFHLRPGISPYSHANEVAKKLRFSPREIKAIVQRKLRRRREEGGQ